MVWIDWYLRVRSLQTNGKKFVFVSSGCSLIFLGGIPEIHQKQKRSEKLNLRRNRLSVCIESTTHPRQFPTTEMKEIVQPPASDKLPVLNA